MSKSWYPLKPPKGNNKLVLWRWHEALDCSGLNIDSSVGSQMLYSKPGDRLFIIATRDDELYLLGTLDVKVVTTERRHYMADEFGGFRGTGVSRSGPFGIFKLGALKWKLRFANSKGDRLVRRLEMKYQVRRHRYLTGQTADLLLRYLSKAQRKQKVEAERRFIEGEKVLREAYRVLRDPALRDEARARWGTACYCCGFDFESFYGDKGNQFVIVHHVDQLADRNGRARATTVKDVRVVCANCHAIIHRVNPPLKPSRLRSLLGQRWGRWSDRGVRAIG